MLTKFGRPLLWLECRHHTAELILKPVWTLLFGDHNSPNIKDFADFKKMWPFLEKSQVSSLSLIPGMEETLKERTVEFLQRLLTNPNRKQQLPRCDYEEVCKLTLLMLGAEVPGGFTWRKPGADHKARFMAKVIYGAKMFFLKDLEVDQNKLEEDGNCELDLEFCEEYKESLERFVKFCSLVYMPYFLASSFGADAPLNDLNLFKLLNDYDLVDPEVSIAALVPLKRHLYYLTEELVVFSLFSNKLDDDTKSQIATKLLTFERPDQFEPEKPHVKCPDINSALDSLVGPKSWLLFHVLGDQGDWLKVSPSKWNEFRDFEETKEFVRAAKVVNDGSERGVKLIQDFCSIITTDSEVRRHLLKSVQFSREKFPDYKKSTLNK